MSTSTQRRRRSCSQAMDAESWPEANKEIPDRAQLTVAPAGECIVGVPVGDPECIRRNVRAISLGKPASLLRDLTTLWDAQASLQVPRFSSTTIPHSLFRVLPPAPPENRRIRFPLPAPMGTRGCYHRSAAARGESGTHAGTGVGSSPATVATRQARLPVREVGPVPPSAVEINDSAFIGCQAPALARPRHGRYQQSQRI